MSNGLTNVIVTICLALAVFMLASQIQENTHRIELIEQHVHITYPTQ